MERALGGLSPPHLDLAQMPGLGRMPMCVWRRGCTIQILGSRPAPTPAHHVGQMIAAGLILGETSKRVPRPLEKWFLRHKNPEPRRPRPLTWWCPHDKEVVLHKMSKATTTGTMYGNIWQKTSFRRSVMSVGSTTCEWEVIRWLSEGMIRQPNILLFR